MASDWAYLPKHLLDAILERLLTSSDYVRFSMVCMPWFSVAKDNQNIRTKKLSSTHQEPPMLLFFNAIEEAWSLYNILDNKVRDDVQLKMPKKRFCGSSKGWLIVVEEDFAVTLINPFLRSKENGEGDIHLPQLVPPDLGNKPLGRQRWVQDCDYYVVKATLTAYPISNADECIVVVIYVERLRMAFTRIGKNMGWTYIDADWCGGIEDVLQLGGDKFCAVMSDKNLVTFNITSESYSDLIEIDCPALPSFESIIRLYLVQSHENDLLLVVRCCDWEDLENLHKRFVSEFQVFKFDFDKCQWIEKTLGGDVALFIGENLSISVVASKFPGCKGNCIYYNHDYDYMNKRDLLYDFGVYDMKTKEISKPYSTKLMALLEMIHQRPIWFTPSFHL